MAEMARKSGDAQGEIDIDRLQDQVLEEIGSAGALDVLEQIRVAELGKKGRITALTKSLGALAPEARREAGQRYNLLKQAIAEAIANRRETLEVSALDAQLLKETVDVTLPIRPEAQGRLHPVSQVTEELIAIFGEMGFRVAEGPDSRTTSTTSPPSTFRPSIPPARCRTPSIWKPRRTACRWS